MSSEVNKKPFKKPFQKFRNNGRKQFGNKFQQAGRKNQRFYQNARSFAKKGSYGHGTHIEEEDFTYFMGILETQQNNKFQSADEKVAMANNVMEQTKDKEIHLASNQVVSKVLENSLGFVDAENLERFFNVFGEGVRPIASDNHASHVLNKVLETAFLRAVGQSVINKEVGPSNPKKQKFEVVSDKNYNMTHEFEEKHRTNCSEFVLRISKFLLNNLEEFFEDRNATHLLRAAILALAGFYIPKTIFYKGKMVNNSERFNGSKHGHRNGQLILDKTLFKVPAEWIDVLMEFPERLQMWPQYKDFPYKYRTAGLIQIICFALDAANKEALDAFGVKLITDTFINVEVPKTPYHENENRRFENDDAEGSSDVKKEANGNGNGEEVKPEADDEEPAGEQPKAEEEEAEDQKVEEEEEQKAEEEEEDEGKPSVFKSDSAVRLLQTLISVASPKLMTKIHDLFKDRLIPLSNGKISSFAVERLINYSTDKSQFEAIFDELCPNFEKFFQTNKSNVVSALSATCLRLKTKQAACITALQNSLHCNASQGADRPKSFFVCLTKLKPFDVLPYDQRKYVSIFGSLMIQDILEFQKPILLVNSILETPVKDLLQVLQSPNGSYIADKFLASTTIGEKSREKFVKLFEGFYMDLAVTKIGSKVLEQFVKIANDGQRLVIAKELTARDNKLKGNVFGRIVYNSLRLHVFKSSPDQWKASWTVKEGAAPEEGVKEEAAAAAAKEEAAPVKEEAAVKIQPPTVTTTPSPKSGKKNKKNNKRPAS